MARFERKVKRNIVKGYLKRKKYTKVNKRVASVWHHLKHNDILAMADAITNRRKAHKAAN